MSTDIYQQRASVFFEQYESVTSEQVHAFWLAELNKRDRGVALDVGAGSGRDAKFLAEKGWQVIAVEPSDNLRQLACESATISQVDSTASYHPISWYADSLPALASVKALNQRYDLVLLSAVLMHLSPIEQYQSLTNLSELLIPGGLLVMTLRHGVFTDGRVSYPVDVDALLTLSAALNLKLLLQSQLVTDQLGRNDVRWQTIVLTKD
ncbi:hypothetical protein HR45_06575 [Shewanella mangrovi]|uniref:Methyltransferase type 11 n=1 Tax=Shewanella mangrovi TaxID=1515746 RepID=A0A094JFY8_9GAMM|nr:class I SAM-dependent methyltransferase [Shewanella mangrovi]KFZ38162.1 hypothetical protein HR45_06575 [Shewanella mangrovi]